MKNTEMEHAYSRLVAARDDMADVTAEYESQMLQRIGMIAGQHLSGGNLRVTDYIDLLSVTFGRNHLSVVSTRRGKFDQHFCVAVGRVRGRCASPTIPGDFDTEVEFWDGSLEEIAEFAMRLAQYEFARKTYLELLVTDGTGVQGEQP